MATEVQAEGYMVELKADNCRKQEVPFDCYKCCYGIIVFGSSDLSTEQISFDLSTIPIQTRAGLEFKVVKITLNIFHFIQQ
jgi:hypothetical protein